MRRGRGRPARTSVSQSGPLRPGSRAQSPARRRLRRRRRPTPGPPLRTQPTRGSGARRLLSHPCRVEGGEAPSRARSRPLSTCAFPSEGEGRGRGRGSRCSCRAAPRAHCAGAPHISSWESPLRGVKFTALRLGPRLCPRVRWRRTWPWRRRLFLLCPPGPRNTHAVIFHIAGGVKCIFIIAHNEWYWLIYYTKTPVCQNYPQYSWIKDLPNLC